MLDKAYLPAEVEHRQYLDWEDNGSFLSGNLPNASPYTIVIPPPNVTGSLHMGHALNNTIQDILIRYHRMKGDDSLWQPGTDHAGIATQMVVERQIEKKGQTRHDLGRDEFIKKIWKWREESGGTIINQLRSLGASCDWSRERFTMDDGLSSAVIKVFVELYKKGLIYRDKRLVNWDPKLHTAISDLEVEQRETLGRLWYFRYPIEGSKTEFISVATTRPETMLGDTGVAVHPEDNRYKDLVGKECRLPLVGRLIQIVADEYSDPSKGSGAVKVTPAHDFNDFEVGQRNKLEMINIFDRDARLNEQVPKTYRGMDRFEARKKIVADMDALGLLEKVEENEMTIPYGDRSGVIIEPWLTDQWFVDAKSLANPAIKAVQEGKTRFVPKQWEKTYFDWMHNIQPWCISRQIWWGHQIPAWFGPDGQIFVELNEADANSAAERHYGKKLQLTRDEDVLDTWFSSALWPFSTLGWPENTNELRKHYPTDVLVTGFDIIFFWVARMMMMGLHFMKEVPFHTVYIHALVRDEQGQKMSKSKGNVMDPLELIEKYGADALRMTLAAHAAQGRDIKLSENRVEGYRNFATKLWNAARYCELNGCRFEPTFNHSACKQPINRWIVGKLANTASQVERGIEDYKFNEAAGSIYQFTWGTFCDWYVEFSKPVLLGDNKEAIAETRATAAWVLYQVLKLLQPFMPFITEELWQKLKLDKGGMLISAKWPTLEDLASFAVNIEMDWVVQLISQVRSLRVEMNVPPKVKIPLKILNADDTAIKACERHGAIIQTLARISEISHTDGDVPEGSIQSVLGESTIILPVSDVIDLDLERARLDKEIAGLDAEIAKFDKKLSNKEFLAKAPAEVIEIQNERKNEALERRAKLSEALVRLS